ncbi:hypothetical protein, partial [Microbispora bryophytorum]
MTRYKHPRQGHAGRGMVPGDGDYIDRITVCALDAALAFPLQYAIKGGRVTAREDLLQALQDLLQRIAATRNSSLALEQSVLAQARQLAEAYEDDGDDIDLRVFYVLGWLYWYRYLALPQGQGHADVETSIDTLIPCFINGVEPLPDPLLPILALKAAPTARRILEQAIGSTDQTMLSATVQLWQRILNATAVDRPERATYLSDLALALQTRFESTGAMADLD